MTKRAANIRVKPAASGKLVRQLSKGNALMILEKYQDEEGNIWYEVSTESGKTYGFVRDYLITLDKGVIVAKRHIHMRPGDALQYNVRDNENVFVITNLKNTGTSSDESEELKQE